MSIVNYVHFRERRLLWWEWLALLFVRRRIVRGEGFETHYKIWGVGFYVLKQEDEDHDNDQERADLSGIRGRH